MAFKTIEIINSDHYMREAQTLARQMREEREAREARERADNLTINAPLNTVLIRILSPNSPGTRAKPECVELIQQQASSIPLF